MWPVWPVYVVMAYFLLALAGPAMWASWRTWRRARVSRQLTCPVIGAPARVTLDPWYAVRMHALGNSELRVLDCACWPERRDCGRECLERAGRAA